LAGIRCEVDVVRRREVGGGGIVVAANPVICPNEGMREAVVRGSVVGEWKIVSNNIGRR